LRKERLPVALKPIIEALWSLAAKVAGRASDVG